MMFRSRAAQTTILATGSALAFMAAAVGAHAQAQGNLDASYTISFARIPVGEITATVVFGDSEYATTPPGTTANLPLLGVPVEGSPIAVGSPSFAFVAVD